MTGKNPTTSAVNHSVEEAMLLTRRTQSSTCVIVLMRRRLSEHLCKTNKSQSMMNERQNCCSGYSSFSNVQKTPKMVSNLMNNGFSAQRHHSPCC